MSAMIPFLVTIPHSGEEIPSQATWLQGLPKEVLLCDVDRFVDNLYEPALQGLTIPFVKTKWHRYAGDLNRLPEDVDASTVRGDSHAAGVNNRGFLWGITTFETKLITEPVEPAIHRALVDLIYEPFHRDVRALYAGFEKSGAKVVYHLDAHSMPSKGTKTHRDPGETRADIVVSDCKGTSCSKAYRDLVIAAYCAAGFRVGYNWPYFGGRVTEQYGHPQKGHEALQVEMNRSLYMDEVSKDLKPAAEDVRRKVQQALSYIKENISHLPRR